jgi:hypothetical protein
MIERTAVKISLLCMLAACGRQAPTPSPVRFRGDVTDPVGDAVADARVPRPPDLVAANIQVTDDNVSFSVRFAPGTFDSATTAVTIQLDADLDSKTGVPLKDMGVDYIVGLGRFAGTRATLSKAANGANCLAPKAPCTYTISSRWPVTFLADGVDATISRAAFERLDGRLNFRIVAYVRPDNALPSAVMDQMPDFSKPPATVR